jgi:hypothetical protein
MSSFTTFMCFDLVPGIKVDLQCATTEKMAPWVPNLTGENLLLCPTIVETGLGRGSI